MVRPAVVALLVATVSCSGLPEPSVSKSSSSTRTLETLSPVYDVDREYRSMKGPSSTQKMRFPRLDPPELVWITGYRAVMVGADGESEMPQQFMCHSNLDFDAGQHAALLGQPVYHTGRLFTLSQGQQDITLPEGFGIPYYTDEELSLVTQVLNLNFDGTRHQVRHQITIDYVLDRDLEEPMTPLFMTSGWGLVLLEGDHGVFGVSEPSEEHGEGCLPGEPASNDLREDGQGGKFSGHWVVPPGRQVNTTRVTQIMNLPYDTTIHYVAVHLHPFAESLELIDRTTGASLFKSNVDGYDDKIGIERVDYYSSTEGLPVFKDHEYEIVSTYDNTTDENQDSMAVMLFYVADKKFKKIERRSIREVKGRPRLSDERLVIETNHGEMEIALYPELAPKHARQILRLARLGVYDTTSFFRIEPGFLIQTSYPRTRSGAPLTAEQNAALEPLAAEFNDLSHRRGIVSMTLNDNDDPDSAVASFSIMLGDAPFLDRRYSIVGEVTEGLDTLQRIERTPRQGSRPTETVEIRKVEVRG